MIRFLEPLFLVPGAAAALIVTALHFLVRSPVRRAPLPTLRFLSSAPRAAVRLRRRPHDVALLLLRVLFALLLAAAFARPIWTARRVDHARILLLDRGAGMTAAWETTIDSVRARLRAAAYTVIVFDTTSIVVPYALADSSWLDTVRDAGVSTVESDYRIALHALAHNAGVVAADTYGATLITTPRWSAFRAGTASVRAAAWPGALELVVPNTTERTTTELPPPRVVASPGTALYDAVEALGWIASIDTAQATVRINGPTAEAQPTGWQFIPDTVAMPAAMVFAGGWTVPTVRYGTFVRVTDGTGAAAAWRDGAVAAIITKAEPCTIATSFDPDTERVTTSPEYPELVRHLVLACTTASRAMHATEELAPTGVLLDSGALRVLEGIGGGSVRATDLPVPPAGRPLGRVLLLLALLCAIVEWPLRRMLQARSATPRAQSIVGADDRQRSRP